MERREFFIRALAVGLGVGSASAAELVESKSVMGSEVALMAPRWDGFEVVFLVNGYSRAWVETVALGKEGGAAMTVKHGADDFGMVPQSANVMRIKVRGLESGVRYRWRVVVEALDGSGSKVETEWREVGTLSAVAEQCHFAVWNDTHHHVDTLRELHRLTPKVDFLVWNGDLCDQWSSEALLGAALIHPGGVSMSEGRPLVVVCGNHDVRGKFAYRMKDYFATESGLPYGCFRQGPVAVVYLHTGEDKPDAHPSFGGRVAMEVLRKRQAEWLKSAIELPWMKEAPYRVVCCHIPLRWTEEVAELKYGKGEYDSYSKSSRDAWHESLVKWGAQVVISGHMHEDGYLEASDKFPYAQMVSGGPTLQNARWIECHADRLHMRLVMKNLSGQVMKDVQFSPIGG